MFILVSEFQRGMLESFHLPEPSIFANILAVPGTMVESSLLDFLAAPCLLFILFLSNQLRFAFQTISSNLQLRQPIHGVGYGIASI